MARILWTLGQLIPRTYWTTYAEVIGGPDGNAGPERFCIWKMWLGRCYDVIDVEVSGPVRSAPGVRAAAHPLPRNT